MRRQAVRSRLHPRGADRVAPRGGRRRAVRRWCGGRRSDWRRGLSLMGDVKYPAGFKHFDYVNPDAPKGGSVRLGAAGRVRQLQHRGRRREGPDRGRGRPGHET